MEQKGNIEVSTLGSQDSKKDDAKKNYGKFKFDKLRNSSQESSERRVDFMGDQTDLI